MHRVLRNLELLNEKARFAFESAHPFDRAPGGAEGEPDDGKSPVEFAVLAARNKAKKEEIKDTTNEELQRQKEQQEYEAEEKKWETVDQSGEAKDYPDEFEKSPEFVVVTSMLEVTKKANAPFSDYETWLAKDPQELKELVQILSQPRVNIFPHGKGRNAFLLGFSADPESKDPPTLDESKKALTRIVVTLRNYFNNKKTAVDDIKGQKEKNIVGDIPTLGLTTLKKSWDNADKTEKLAIGVCIALGVKYLYDNWDKEGFIPFTKTKLKDLVYGFGALWGINYMSGKVSPDGQTLLQRTGLFDNVSNLKDENMLKTYAKGHGMGENQEALRTLVNMQFTDVKKLYKLYKKHRVDGSNKIDDKELINLGLKKGDVDGGHAYTIMKTIVEETSVHEHEHRLVEEWRLTSPEAGMHYIESDNIDKAKWKEPGIAEKEFERKYISGSGRLAQMNQRVIDVIINEYHTTNWQQRAAIEAANSFPNQAIYLGGILKDTALEWGGIGKNYVFKKMGEAYDGVEAHILNPLTDYTARYYRKTKEYFKEILAEHEAVILQEKLQRVLPADMPIEPLKAGTAFVMGYPVEYKDGKLGGVAFDLEKGIPENKKSADELRTKITAHVQKLLDTHVKGKTPTWNPTLEQWEVSLDANGNKHLNLPRGSVTVSLEISDDGKTLTFNTNGKKIINLKDLDTVREQGEIQKQIWDTYPYLEGLKVDSTIKADGTIEGKIAGLSFNGTSTLNARGLPTIDINPTTITIDKSNGGEKFLEEKALQLMGDPKFLNPIIKLLFVMQTASEGAVARFNTLFPQTKLWFIPTDVDPKGALNGKILNNEWEYMVKYKQVEMLDNFRAALAGKTLDQVEVEYDNLIAVAKDMKQLALDIEAETNDEQKAKNFPTYLEKLETVNYTGDYKVLYGEYKKMISNPKFNYAGFESLSDVPGAAGESFKIYEVLQRVWSYATRYYRNTGVTDGSLEANKIRNFINTVENILLQARQKGNGTIRLSNLPPHDTEAQIKKDWVLGDTILTNTILWGN